MLSLSGLIVSFQCATRTLHHHVVRSSLRACYDQSATEVVSLIIRHTMYISSLFPYRGFCLHTHFDISVYGCKFRKALYIPSTRAGTSGSRMRSSEELDVALAVLSV
jgi:hypothetical protein